MSKKPSAECPHRPPCPGCPHWGENDVPPEKLGKLRKLAREAGIRADDVLTGTAGGYRHRARLAIRGRANTPKIGVFQAQSHRIADIPRCFIQHPEINRTTAALRRAIRRTKTEPYVDGPHRGLLRYVQILVPAHKPGLQVSIVTNSDSPTSAEPLFEALERELETPATSLWWNGQPERSNSILGPHWQLVNGSEFVTDRVHQADVHFHPAAFSQSNPLLFDRIVEKIVEVVPAKARILELYCGVGGIGLNLIDRASSIVFNERSRASLEGLEMSLSARPAAEQDIASIAAGPAADIASAIADHDVVIADPARKGLESEVLKALIKSPPEIFILVSCGFDSFLRDAKRLIESRSMTLSELLPVALFPYGDQVETVAVFRS